MNAQFGVVRGHDDECVPPQRESGSPGRTRARGDPDRATGDRRAGCGAPVRGGAPSSRSCKVCPRSRDSTLVYLKKNGTYSQSGDPPTLTGRHRFESVPLTLVAWLARATWQARLRGGQPNATRSPLDTSTIRRAYAVGAASSATSASVDSDARARARAF